MFDVSIAADEHGRLRIGTTATAWPWAADMPEAAAAPPAGEGSNPVQVRLGTDAGRNAPDPGLRPVAARGRAVGGHGLPQSRPPVPPRLHRSGQGRCGDDGPEPVARAHRGAARQGGGGARRRGAGRRAACGAATRHPMAGTGKGRKAQARRPTAPSTSARRQKRTSAPRRRETSRPMPSRNGIRPIWSWRSTSPTPTMENVTQERTNWRNRIRCRASEVHDVLTRIGSSEIRKKNCCNERRGRRHELPDPADGPT